MKRGVDRRKARAWMVMNDIRLVDIQRDLKMNSYTQVVETMQGQRSHRKVLGWLLKKGCPASYLELPRDMKEKRK